MALSLMLILPAQAHDRSESFSEWSWQEDGKLFVTASVLSREVTALANAQTRQGLSEAFGAHFVKQVKLTPEQGICQLAGKPASVAAQNGYLRLEATFDCPANIHSLQLDIGLFQQVSSSHVHYAMVKLLASNEKVEYLFSKNSLSQLVPLTAQTQESHAERLSHIVIEHLKSGVEHILSGLDHILFLLAICLVARSFTDLFWMITGFTLGHSLSLVLTVLGYLSPEAALVEAFIGFSIFLVSCEIVLDRYNRRKVLALVALLPVAIAISRYAMGYSWLFAVGLVFIALFSISYLLLTQQQKQMSQALKAGLTALFGVVHGFGFANSFLAMGLGDNNLGWKLAAFNLGVELGQVLLVLTALALGYLIKQFWQKGLPSFIRHGAILSLSGMGMFWFIERSL